MIIKNSREKYGSIAKLFHWLMAIIILTMIPLGLYMQPLPISSEKLKLYGWHKQWGVTVFILVLCRLGWRSVNVIPPMPAHLATWQKWAAHSVHFALYAFMIFMPLTGWMMSSAADLPVSFFGLFVLPDLVGPNETLRVFFATTHKWLAYGLILALVAHIGAALQHHFIYKDSILRRMLPWTKV